MPFKFRRELWCQKTRVAGVSCGIIYVILCSAVLIQYWSVTDRHTHRDRHTTTAYTAVSIASRGKNGWLERDAVWNGGSGWPTIFVPLDGSRSPPPMEKCKFLEGMVQRHIRRIGASEGTTPLIPEFWAMLSTNLLNVNQTMLGFESS